MSSRIKKSLADRNFKFVDTNGVTLRTVVEGEGPLVIMVHGWPQGWYLWRKIIDPIIAAGFRVAVPDMRGYGESSCPSEVEEYNIRKLAGDVAGIAKALGDDSFIVVGHDWGNIVSWYTALLYPDHCAAVMGLSVPFWRVGPDIAHPAGHDEDMWYIRYFIENPGRVEEEFAEDIERTLLGIYYACSAEAGQHAFFKQFELPRTGKLLDAFPLPEKFPRFMTREDLAYYVEQYRKSGFQGLLNWYRDMPNIAASTPELQDKKIRQPAAFICGAEDPTLLFDEDWRPKFEASFDDLRFIELIQGSGHWLQVERPEETAAQILRFLDQVRLLASRTA